MAEIASIISAILLLFTASPVNATCPVNVQIPYRWQGARVAAVSFAFPHAAVSTLRAPPGWRFDVDNDASWRTRVSGLASVGAAFIPASSVGSLIEVVPEPGRACSDHDGTVAGQVTLTFYRGDRLHKVALPQSALTLGN